MWKNNPVHLRDLQSITTDSSIPWSELEGKSILVTGATGLIGSNLVNALLYYGETTTTPPHVLAFVHNKEKAKHVFAEQLEEHTDTLSFVAGDICDPQKVQGPVDYIIHAASETASRSFITNPVEVIRTAVTGTWNMLELAREKKVKGFLYLSSMEIYGAPETDEKIDESAGTNLNTMHVRNSYPGSKRICESLCTAFFSEYGVPAKVIRLAQTFGPGIAYDDGRVFAEFTRCVIENKDIILHTDGKTKRNYLYTMDAVSAILNVLVNGKNGNAYNAANEDTYCSIYEMATLVAEQCAEGKIAVQKELEDIEALGYAPTLKMNLSSKKLQELGWHATVGLMEMYHRMIFSSAVVGDEKQQNGETAHDLCVRI